MNRLYDIQCALLKIIDTQDPSLDRDETLDWERLHMASSARLAWLLAIERSTDPEISAIAAALHDFGRIITGRQSDHAEAGYLPVREFLLEIGLFSTEEIAIISTAVKNHSNKTTIGTPIDEIVKDADVIDCYQYGLPFDRLEKQLRYEAWLKTHEAAPLEHPNT